jgi:hypothetical protein
MPFPSVYARSVIYVLDRNGSVAGTFDEIRTQAKESICRLVARQRFHVVCFAKGSYRELRAKRAVYATEDNKRLALKALDGIQAVGAGSNPVPALEVAFKVIRDTPYKKGLCYILTTQDFSAGGYEYKVPEGGVLTGNEAVLAWLRANNEDHSVRVYPCIFGPPPSADTEAFLKKLAEENKGRYKYVTSKPRDPG